MHVNAYAQFSNARQTKADPSQSAAPSESRVNAFLEQMRAEDRERATGEERKKKGNKGAKHGSGKPRKSNTFDPLVDDQFDQSASNVQAADARSSEIPPQNGSESALESGSERDELSGSSGPEGTRQDSNAKDEQAAKDKTAEIQNAIKGLDGKSMPSGKAHIELLDYLINASTRNIALSEMRAEVARQLKDPNPRLTRQLSLIYSGIAGLGYLQMEDLRSMCQLRNARYSLASDKYAVNADLDFAETELRTRVPSGADMLVKAKRSLP